MELATIEEETQLNELYIQMEQEGLSGEISYDAIAKLIEFKRQIASAITDRGIATSENADVSTMSSNIRNLTGVSSADKVSYDNSNSKLVATNVQGAVDELDSEIDELNESLGKSGETVNGTTIQEKLDYLINGMNANWNTTLLWTGNITSTFGGGIIHLDLSKYNHILINFSHMPSQAPTCYSLVAIDGTSHYCGASSPDGVRSSTRNVIANSNGVTFSEKGCSDNTYNVQYCIPANIYGVNINV